MKKSIKALLLAGSALVALCAVVFVLRPSPVLVETARIGVGTMQVTADEQGETRAHDRFIVAAPVGGRLMRVLLRDGDTVVENQIVATIAPLPLSGRERDELNARVAAAEAIQRAAEAQLSHVLEDLAQAQRESMRLEELFGRSLVSRQQLEQAQNSTVTLEKEVSAARYRVKSAAADLRGARAGLAALETGPRASVVIVRAPNAGRVLRVLEPSERVLGAGSPILVIGDLEHLEVMLEMLSSEAVKVSAGMPAMLEGWGGDEPLMARVRLVEPYAYTKISALGVEEKRTRVILDFVGPSVALGDGFRVTGQIIIWEAPAVLKVPIAALFRCELNWCVFVVDGKRARRRRVQISHRNAVEAEVVEGLTDGQIVVRHPPNELDDGARVRPIA